MPEDEQEGVWDIKRGDKRVRRVERNERVLGAGGEAQQGDGLGKRRN